MIKDYSFYVRADANVYSSVLLRVNAFITFPPFQKIDLISAMFNPKVTQGDVYLHPGVSDAYWIDDVDTVYQRLGYQCRFQLGSYGSAALKGDYSLEPDQSADSAAVESFLQIPPNFYFYAPDPVPLISNVNKIHLQSMFNFAQPGGVLHFNTGDISVLYYGYLKLNLE